MGQSADSSVNDKEGTTKCPIWLTVLHAPPLVDTGHGDYILTLREERAKSERPLLAVRPALWYLTVFSAVSPANRH